MKTTALLVKVISITTWVYGFSAAHADPLCLSEEETKYTMDIIWRSLSGEGDLSALAPGNFSVPIMSAGQDVPKPSALPKEKVKWLADYLSRAELKPHFAAINRNEWIFTYVWNSPRGTRDSNHFPKGRCIAYFDIEAPSHACINNKVLHLIFTVRKDNNNIQLTQAGVGLDSCETIRNNK